MASAQDQIGLIMQLRRRGIRDNDVLRAIERVPRDLFVDPEWEDYAYRDEPLPIACGQTISQPYVVAYMTEKLGLDPRHKVLEIGTGSGYQAAVLSHLCRRVYTVERWRE
ncbi:MAG: protein-L-isoaspartate O-methyltransferase, partial [Methyloceanibacter sp.]